MLRFRPDIGEISPYKPGRPIADVAREHGFDPNEIVKLASNECPLPPIQAVQDVIAAGVGSVHRYPDNECLDLRAALSDQLDVPDDHLWIGAGSSELLRCIAMSMGGPGTSAVYGWPSFVIYRLASIIAMTNRIEVPLASGAVMDLDAMRGAITDDTTVVYVCNPNNPTGTYRPADEIARFIDAVPDDVLVVVDEAYHEFVTATDHETSIPLALERPNVLTIRTFSKIHGLAALRVGYGIGQPDLISSLRKSQAPFTVTSLGQTAATESLNHPDEVEKRRQSNAKGRAVIETGLRELGVEYVPSQANFVFFRLAGGSAETSAGFIKHGVILRSFSRGWVRVSVGSDEENRRFLDALKHHLTAVDGD